MHLNLDLFISRSRVLTLAVPFSLAMVAGCFTGGDVGIAGTETGTMESGSTDDGTCEVGTEGCPCTMTDGCNAGLMCVGDTCQAISSDCGNGSVEPGEMCDDGNNDNTDNCTTLCMPPSCSDGIVSGDEIAADCGIAACGTKCEAGEPCVIANDCIFPVCGSDGDGGTICQHPRSCLDYKMFTPNAEDGNIVIDLDGADGELPEFEVFCHMSKDGGGWTLAFVASDDNTNTWTWNNRAKLANEPDEVGSLDATNEDFMSRAYHNMPISDVLFIHQPSDVWAAYNGVSNGMTIGQVIFAAGSPVCDYALQDMGFELSEGTLTASGQLCDTDLYFSLGDHEIDLASCMDFGSGSNTASFGPVWSADKGAGCPFDDPAEFGLGPHGPCGACPNNFPSTEFNYLGFANALMLNSGTAGMAQNYMQMYVR